MTSQESVAYEISIRPEPGTMFVIKHFGRWYLQDSGDVFYGPYELPLEAIGDKNPVSRRLEELPSA